MVIWITGLSGSGKTTIGKRVYKYIKTKYINTVFLDGDIIRKALNYHFGYTLEDRHASAIQIHGICNMLEKENLIVICSTISLFHDIHKMNRNNFNQYIEIYLDCKMNTLKTRRKELCRGSD